jgi:hypothetical protein
VVSVSAFGTEDRGFEPSPGRKVLGIYALQFVMLFYNLICAVMYCEFEENKCHNDLLFRNIY